MKRGQRGELRYFAFLTAFLCSMFFSGCGNSSDGGGNPAGILPLESIRGGVEGYVSRSELSPGIKANIGSTLAHPFADATVTLSAFDPTNGNEVILGQGQTDDRGYYQIPYTLAELPGRNLLVHAVKGTESSECVLPMLKPGVVVRAQTMNPGHCFEAQLVRELGRIGKSGDFNLSELTSMLPDESLDLLEKSIDSIVSALLAREDARRLKFGNRIRALADAAFEIEQSIAEAVENGDLSAEEGRTAFIRRLEERARTLGFTSEELNALDDYDTAFLYKPLQKLFIGAHDESGAETGFETCRLRESKRNTLFLIADSVTALVGEKSRTEFAGFYQLIEKMREQLDGARTPAEVRAVFSPESLQMKEFTGYLGTILLSLAFTPELVAEVFTMQPPRLLDSAAADGLTKTASPGGSSGFDPAGLVRQQDRIMTDLTEAVRHVAGKAALSLTEEQLKAIALLLWAKSPEKLDFTVSQPVEVEHSDATEKAASGPAGAEASGELSEIN